MQKYRIHVHIYILLPRVLSLRFHLYTLTPLVKSICLRLTTTTLATLMIPSYYQFTSFLDQFSYFPLHEALLYSQDHDNMRSSTLGGSITEAQAFIYSSLFLPSLVSLTLAKLNDLSSISYPSQIFLDAIYLDSPSGHFVVKSIVQ